MRIACWNINSVRPRVGLLTDWLAAHQPDVVLLQETKCRDADFPSAELARLGYQSAHHGRDHYNGVAVISRIGLDDVEAGFPGPQRPPFDEPRLIAATCGGIRVVSIYVPNGREAGDDHWLFKLVWLERLRGLLWTTGAADGATVVAGDFNVAPADIDLYDPKRWRGKNHATPQERAAYEALVDLGFADVLREHQPQPGVYTWWNYRPHMLETNRGMRIDLALVSRPLVPRVRHAWVEVEVRRRPPTSDHAPIVVDLT